MAARRPVGLENLFGPPKQKSKSEELAMKRAANRSWHRPPQIVPNYGSTKRNIHPKSNLSRVLLHDNNSQQVLLDARLSHIDFEREKSGNLFDLHKKAFLVQQSLKQHHLRESGIKHLSFLPNSVANGYCQFYGNSMGLKMDVISDNKKKRTSSKSSREKSSITDILRGGGVANGQSPVRETPAEERPSDMQMLSVQNGQQSLHNGVSPSPNLLPTIGSAKPEFSKSRITQSALPGENRPSSRAFLTHDYQLRRGHTFTTPRYSAKKRSRSTEPRYDPRFVLLHRSLIPNERDLGGFMSLSPSGAAVLEKYGHVLSSE